MKVLGTGSALPSKVVTNDDLSKMVETNDEWIRTRTGICSRRVLSTESITDLAVLAAQRCIEDAGIACADIDYILCHNMIGDTITPSMAALINKEIEANCPTLDLNSACTGFIYSLDVAEALLKSGRAKNILVVCAEQTTYFTDWEKRETCVLFGDGAGAVVVTSGGDDCEYKISTQYTDALNCNQRYHGTPFREKQDVYPFLEMKGRDVFKLAVTHSYDDIKTVLEKKGITPNEVKYFLLHQANVRILDAIRHELDLSEEKFPYNINDHGNTSSASIPMLLDELNKEGKLKEDDYLVLSAFGAGFTSGACVLKW